jgi:hypothetical protein
VLALKRIMCEGYIEKNNRVFFKSYGNIITLCRKMQALLKLVLGIVTTRLEDVKMVILFLDTK